MVHSSRRRPPGSTEGVTTTKSILTWTLFALFYTAQARTDQINPIPYRSALTADSSHPAISSRSHPGRSPAEIPLLDRDTPTAKFRSTDNENANIHRYQDALAPAHDISAVRAPPAQSSEGSDSGISALPPARLLQDWEAEDIVLLSTIDGALHARDRQTGRHRWTLETPDSPMIETVNYPLKRSEAYGSQSEDDYMFIVEPSKDGQLFAQFMDPQIGLVRLGATVRKMATEGPVTMRLNGHQLTTVAEQSFKFYTIDMSSGEILYEVSPGRRNPARSDSQSRCRRRNELELEDPACKPGRTIRLGRNTYSFTISDEQLGQDLCVITFSEWTTQKGDIDLQSQYEKSLDGHHIQTFYDGRIIGIESTASEDSIPRYQHRLDSPIAQVFDIVRSLDDQDDAAELVLLSRPMDLPFSAQAQDWRVSMKDSQRVYVNQTEAGQWYALSEFSYPGITTEAQFASVHRRPDGKLLDRHGDLQDIIGVHILSTNQVAAPIRLTISQGAANDNRAVDQNHQVAPIETPVPPELPASPGAARYDWMSTLLAMLITGILVAYSGRVRDMVAPKVSMMIKHPAPKSLAMPVESVVEAEVAPVIEVVQKQLSNMPALQPVETRESVQLVNVESRDSDVIASSQPQIPRQKSRGSEDDSGSEGDSDNDGDTPEDNNGTVDANKTRRKPTKRGKRGGRKNKKKAMDPATFAPKPVLAAELQLDDSMIQVGRLKVDTREENCLGHGSNGTTVYPGSYEGMQVAVKRLVKSTNDLASKEIQHLMSSMENNHIIRYVCKEESLNFFYIALDRYTTSLDQFIEHPEKFPSLVSGPEKFDVKDCLRQITEGVRHLHSLKLVHRDIKPQNVLVKAIKSERPGRPKLHFVISDFGLCKPLDEGAMSTFAPTANHTAAGTTGWRAPELLVNSRDCIAAPDADSTASRSSTVHSSTIDGTIIDRPSGRRATKAIDIFSLGCVYYYVMTRGCHPFDRGGTSLGRDLNIKENNVTTSDLRLHQYEFDADDLVLQMLKHDPKSRPSCDAVLLHPYFWDAHTKLNFVCAVSNSYENVKNSISNIHDEHAVRTSDEKLALSELAALESLAPNVIGLKKDNSTTRDFLTALPSAFINEMGKQRKYTGTKMIDLLRVIRNKFQHFDDITPSVRNGLLGGSPRGYYRFWSSRFPSLLINCHCLILERGLVGRFQMERFYGVEEEGVEGQ